MTTPVIISASRRTDLPRFYLDLLEQEARQRRFRWHHPFTQRPVELALAPDQPAVLVLWSKDFGPFLRRRDAFEGWPLFFHFTITTPVPMLEPDLPPLAHRLDQLRRLVTAYGARAVRWRFDPIVCWESDGVRHDNLGKLEAIAAEAAEAGLRDVTLSFMDRYRKIDRRVASTPVVFAYLSDDQQAALCAPQVTLLQSMGFTIHTCCEPALTAIPGVRPGRCIDAELLSAVSGLSLPANPDAGQRRQQGCGCHQSIDIGCYVHHRCPGQCLYCYARP